MLGCIFVHVQIFLGKRVCLCEIAYTEVSPDMDTSDTPFTKHN